MANNSRFKNLNELSSDEEHENTASKRARITTGDIRSIEIEQSTPQMSNSSLEKSKECRSNRNKRYRLNRKRGLMRRQTANTNLLVNLNAQQSNFDSNITENDEVDALSLISVNTRNSASREQPEINSRFQVLIDMDSSDQENNSETNRLSGNTTNNRLSEGQNSNRSGTCQRDRLDITNYNISQLQRYHLNMASPINVQNERERNRLRRQNPRQNLLAQFNNICSRELYMKEFDSTKHGKLEDQAWVQDLMVVYHQKIQTLKQYHCRNCYQLWPTANGKCSSCKTQAYKLKFCIENQMVPNFSILPNDVQLAFEELTMIEEMLISPIQPIMSVFRIKGGRYIRRGYCANFTQDIQPICDQLPLLPKDISILLIQKKNIENKNIEFKVNRNRVQLVLTYLCQHNQLWRENGIHINEQNLNALPEDGILTGLTTCYSDNERQCSRDRGPEMTSTIDIEEQDYHTLVEIDFEERQQLDKIHKRFSLPVQNVQLVDEYKTEGILSLSFPKLFPNCLGDPTVKSRLRKVTETEAYRHLIKYACKSAKSGELYYPFVEHERFMFLVSDRLRRHRANDQCSVYFKQNPCDKAMTVADLMKIIKDGTSAALMKRMTPYSANITGSDAYWSRRRAELTATFEQKGCGTFFFTFSYADNHWADLHELLPGKKATNHTDRYKCVLKNTALVDWYFSYRLNRFLEYAFDKVLGCEWRWHRYEWQSRDSIHAHGTARLKNDAGLVDLTAQVYHGELIRQKYPESESIEHREIISKSIQSKKRLITYIDTLVTAMNEDNFAARDQEIPMIHPACIDISLIERSQIPDHYTELINCTQRHVCRKEGYCSIKKKSTKTTQQCRFGYPFEQKTQTEISFTQTNTTIKAHCNLARNDPYMNQHIPFVAHHWRANVDSQPILDYRAAVEYMVKYATKGESVGSEFTNLLKEVASKAQETDDVSKKLKSLFLRYTVSKRDKGKAEIARSLLGEPLYHSTFTYLTINLEVGNRKIALLANQPGDANDTELTQKSLIDYYSVRYEIPRLSLTEVYNYLDFAKKFELKGGNLVSRTITNLVLITTPYVKFNKNDKTVYNHYCYYQLIKYSPWKKDDLESINMTTAADKWHEFLEIAPQNIKDSIRFTQSLHDRLRDVYNSEKEIETEVETVQEDWMAVSEIAPNLVSESPELSLFVDTEYDWSARRNSYSFEELELMQDWLNEQKSKDEARIESDVPRVMPEQLNRLQKLAYNLIKTNEEEGVQSLMILMGTAGTGKSFTIYAISTYLQNRVKRGAPTAKAAFLIKGDTLHALFNLPVSNKTTYTPMSSSKLLQIQELFRGIDFIIIDEFSMIDQPMFAYIDQRCREIKQKFDKYFGGFSVVLAGDPGQLLPVCGKSLYDSRCMTQLEIQGNLAYQQFENVIILEQVMRQELDVGDLDQKMFIELLPRLRNGTCTEEDWKHLLKRKPTPSNKEEFSSSQRLFSENKECDKYNLERLSLLNTPVTLLMSLNNYNGRQLNSDHFMGLENLIYVSIGAQITLVTNLWKRNGLTNGTSGVIKDIIYKENRENNDLPVAIIIHFPCYTGPQFFNDSDKHNWVPINKISAFDMSSKATRTNYPLKLGYATTIHKSQGSTLSKGVVDFGKSERNLGSSFVALSRFKRFDSFLLEAHSFERITKDILKSTMLKPRQLEEERLEQLFNKTLEKYSDEV